MLATDNSQGDGVNPYFETVFDGHTSEETFT
jgi:hypothetical protein